MNNDLASSIAIRWYYVKGGMGFGWEAVLDGRRIARFDTLEEAVLRYPDADLKEA